MAGKNLYTIPQAAGICGVGRSTMWRWVKSGQLRSAATAGGHHRIYSEDLQMFLDQNQMRPQLRTPTTQKRILIVDDDAPIRKLIHQLLEGEGYELAIAIDGFDAGQQTIAFQPHLVILDLFMPELDGFEVCRRLKKNKKTEKIKIIAVSGFDTEENRKRILGNGADLFLSKPLDTKLIKRVIRKMLA